MNTSEANINKVSDDKKAKLPLSAYYFFLVEIWKVGIDWVDEEDELFKPEAVVGAVTVEPPL